MKVLVLIPVLIFSFSAFAEMCSVDDIKYVSKMISNDLEVNGSVVTSALNDIASGKAECDVSNTKFKEEEVSIDLCGAASSVEQKIYTIASRYQNGFLMKLAVIKDEVQCQGTALWLKRIDTTKGNMLRYIQAGDKLLVQIKSDGCIKTEHYIPVRFITENYFNRPLKRTKLLFTGTDLSCFPGEERDEVLEFSMKELGLTVQDLKNLH